jgi:hypothetical protein
VGVDTHTYYLPGQGRVAGDLSGDERLAELLRALQPAYGAAQPGAHDSLSVFTVGDAATVRVARQRAEPAPGHPAYEVFDVAPEAEGGPANDVAERARALSALRARRPGH